MNPYVQYMYGYPHKTAYGSLRGVFLQDYAHLLSGSSCGLYLHIPFCQTKCGYCNLFSVAGQKREEIDGYLSAVEKQARQYREILSSFGTEFSQVSIGGGTPLILSENQIERMFSILENNFRYSQDRELAIETAPNQTEKGKLRLLKQAGTTRVSIGVQSFFDQELSRLGRRHCARKAREALELLQAFDFSCVNVDLIYGIPGQTVESLLSSLKEALSFEPEEIFLYPLYIRRGAWLKLDMDPESAFQQYQEASAFLRGEGWRQDSMRRFVKMEESRIFSECGGGTSLALGCGGRSYLGNLHFCAPYRVAERECLEQLEKFEAVEDFSEITHGILLTEEEMKRRYLIRHLLIRPGLDIRRYRESFGREALTDFPLLQEWAEQGYVETVSKTEGDYLTLTKSGLGLSDYLGPQLISGDVREKMKKWEAVYDRKDHVIPGKFEKL